MSSTAETNGSNQQTDCGDSRANGHSARGMATHMRASEPGMVIGDLGRDGGRREHAGKPDEANDEHGLVFLLAGYSGGAGFTVLIGMGSSGCSGQEMGGPGEGGEWRVQGWTGI